MTAPMTTRAPVTGGPAPTADEVAAVVAKHPAIGSACAALNDAGWPSLIAGNRITVAGEILALFIAEGAGESGRLVARWVVYGIHDRRLVRAVVSDQKASR